MRSILSKWKSASMSALRSEELMKPCFNRINPNRSIPTNIESWGYDCYYLFQSYQSRQINPDFWSALRSEAQTMPCFNRINSDRSIPTKGLLNCIKKSVKFQSYQSRQINPDPDLGQKFYPVE